MYYNHFGLSQPPFKITPNIEFFFAGGNRGPILEALIYAVAQGEGIIKVTGEVGSGKTMLCRVLMERLPPAVETIYLGNPSLSRDEILFAIGDELKLDMQEKRATRVLRGLQEHLIRLFGEGRRVVVLIDEAHAMPKETLEEIRLLSNLESNRHKLLQIVLFGQPELDEHLSTPEMRQLKERITHGFRLEPLVRGDIENYVDFRMRAAGYRGPQVFSRGAVKLIASASQGLTRRVNILADKALLAAFADGTHAVTEAEVRKAVRDTEFYRRRFSLHKAWIAAGALAAGLVIGWGTHVLLSTGERAIASGPVSDAARARVAAIPASPAIGTESNVQSAAPVVAVTSPPPPPGNAAAPGVFAPRAPPARVRSPEPVALAPDAEPARRGSPAPPERGEFVRERFKATQEWLQNAPDDRYAIQLVTVNSGELRKLEDFLLRASAMVPAGELLVYSVKIDGRQHYRVAYGSYASPEQALDAIKGLPPLFSAYHPYYRSVERMRSQNRQ
jgi:type II secretory pathway predicted ATPase ExeA/septal ring-binding cell division protein DamX